MTALLVLGDDRITRMVRARLGSSDDVVIASDHSGGIGRVARLVRRKRLGLRDVARMALAEFRRPAVDIHSLPDDLTFSTNAELLAMIDRVEPDRIVLFRAGLVINSTVLARGIPIHNVHCARLPEFGGLNSIQRARRSDITEHFASLHVVEAEIDRGELLDSEPYDLTALQSYSDAETEAYEAGARLLARTLDLELAPPPSKPGKHQDVVPILLAVISVAVVAYREFRGLAGVMTTTLSPAELIAAQRNPFLSTVGFRSGSELTAISLPLRGYELLDHLGFDVLNATRIMIMIEALWFFVGVAWAVRIARPQTTLTVASVAACVGTVGSVLSGNNLANWGFLWGWNYGFAYAVVCVALAFGLRGRWTPAAITTALLLTIHSVVAVLTVLTLAPILCVDALRRRVSISWIQVILTTVVSSLYLLWARGNVAVGAAELDVDAYIARVRGFQWHLFYELDLSYLRSFSPDIGAWALAALVATATAVFVARDDSRLAAGILAAVSTITVMSFIGWWHSELSEPNTTVLLLALHRSSVFVNLLILVIALPIALEHLSRGRQVAAMGTLAIWCLVPRSNDRVLLGLAITVAVIVWTIPLLWRAPSHLIAGFSLIVTAFAAVAATYFLVTATNQSFGSARRALIAVKDDAGLLMLTTLLCLLAIAPFLARWSPLLGRLTTPARGWIGGTAIVLLGLALTVGTSFFDNPRARGGRGLATTMSLFSNGRVLSRHRAPTSSYRQATTDSGGGSSLSAASAGKPREWLHYGFLYSRDQDTLIDGTARAELYGVDVDDWFAQNPQIRAGTQLVQEITSRYNTMTDAELLDVAAELEADYFVFEQPMRVGSPCFEQLYANGSYWVAKGEASCVGDSS